MKFAQVKSRPQKRARRASEAHHTRLSGFVRSFVRSFSMPRATIVRQEVSCRAAATAAVVVARTRSVDPFITSFFILPPQFSDFHFITRIGHTLSSTKSNFFRRAYIPSSK